MAQTFVNLPHTSTRASTSKLLPLYSSATVLPWWAWAVHHRSLLLLIWLHSGVRLHWN